MLALRAFSFACELHYFLEERDELLFNMLCFFIRDFAVKQRFGNELLDVGDWSSDTRALRYSLRFLTAIYSGLDLLWRHLSQRRRAWHEPLNYHFNHFVNSFYNLDIINFWNKKCWAIRPSINQKETNKNIIYSTYDEIANQEKTEVSTAQSLGCSLIEIAHRDALLPKMRKREPPTGPSSSSKKTISSTASWRMESCCALPKMPHILQRICSQRWFGIRDLAWTGVSRKIWSC